jgi:hypothetical protein
VELSVGLAVELSVDFSVRDCVVWCVWLTVDLSVVLSVESLVVWDDSTHPAFRGFSQIFVLGLKWRPDSHDSTVDVLSEQWTNFVQSFGYENRPFGSRHLIDGPSVGKKNLFIKTIIDLKF